MSNEQCCRSQFKRDDPSGSDGNCAYRHDDKHRDYWHYVDIGSDGSVFGYSGGRYDRNRQVWG